MLQSKFLFFGKKLIEKAGWLFAPLSFIYALIVYCRNFFYDLKGGTRVFPIVVSVGNVVVGGSGKTPFVQMLAEQFPKRRVAIISRGYGSVPDEAIQLQRRLPRVPVFVGKNRARLAQEIDADLIILDDGMQHRKLHRDFDILLGETKGHYLPWGFLRDSPNRRHDAHFELGKNLELKVARIVDLHGKELPSVQGRKVGIFSGIARPERFKKTVEGLGAKIVSEVIFADHEKADLTKLDPSLLWICTEKDQVKLGQTDLTIYYLEMKMEIVAQKEIWQKLVEKIDMAIDNR